MKILLLILLSKENSINRIFSFKQECATELIEPFILSGYKSSNFTKMYEILIGISKSTDEKVIIKKLINLYFEQ